MKGRKGATEKEGKISKRRLGVEEKRVRQEGEERRLMKGWKKK